jgi:hypothetical protein
MFDVHDLTKQERKRLLSSAMNTSFLRHSPFKKSNILTDIIKLRMFWQFASVFMFGVSQTGFITLCPTRFIDIRPLTN